jgi:hypothetical protein
MIICCLSVWNMLMLNNGPGNWAYLVKPSWEYPWGFFVSNNILLSQF